jgi:hypothetical protein
MKWVINLKYYIKTNYKVIFYYYDNKIQEATVAGHEAKICKKEWL